MGLNSKQRSYLTGLANNLDVVVHVGKASLTDEIISAVEEVIEKRELIKIAVLKNCMDDPKEIANALAESTHSEVVHVIGKKIILYRRSRKEPVIALPKD